HFHLMREADGQGAYSETVLGRHQATDHGVATLTVEDLAGGEVALSCSDGIGTKPVRTACRLAIQPNRCDTDAELKADQMPALIHGGVATFGIGDQTVLGKAAAHVVRVTLKGDEHTPADMMWDPPPVALKRRQDLHLTLEMELPAFRFRPANEWQIVEP